MTRIVQLGMLIFESVGCTLLLFLLVSCIVYGVDRMHENGTQIQANSSCDNSGRSMRIKKIMSVDNEMAKLQMVDSSIIDYQVKHYLRDYKGHVTIKYENVNVGDFVCVSN